MNKAGNTYLDKKSSKRSKSRKRSGSGAKSGVSVTRWMALGVVIGTMTILCLAVNIRAFVEMNRQSIENQKLNTEIKQLNSTNLVLEEEIKNLKGDPKTIEREARKIGMSRPNEKILVPVN